MGMTINESITELEKARDSIEPCLFIDEAIDQSMKTAITIMHKYQKIEEIYKNWCYPTHINAVEAMNKLGEVIKDGNDD